MSITEPARAEPANQAAQLRLGEQILAADGAFGELARIVVDPMTRAVTHLVVQPSHRHLQSRLVPIDIVRAGRDGLDVELTLEELRALPRVGFSEFVPLASPIDVGDNWEIVDQEVVAQPYWGGDVLGMGRTWDEQAHVTFDRIPKGECEIRRDSKVIGDRGQPLGHVEGLVVDHTHVTGVVVRTGLKALRHFVVVPLGDVDTVTNDAIGLSIGRAAFDALPSADHKFAPDPDSMPSPLQAQLGTLVTHLLTSVRSARNRILPERRIDS